MRGIKHVRESYIPVGAIKIIDKDSDAVVYIYFRSESGYLGGVAFHGRAQKPDWQYRFNNEAQRESRVKSFFESRQTQTAYKREAQAKLAAMKAKGHGVKVGNIYYSSWGYDQTNVDFYQVIELKGKQSVIIQSIASKQEGNMDQVVAVKDFFLESDGWRSGPMTKRISPHGHLKISGHEYAYPWDGSPCYKTPAGMGH